MTSSECCGVHVKTCATIVGILGLIGSIMSIGSVVGGWFGLPLSILMIATYVFILVGIHKEKASFLLPAQIILGINVVLSVILILAFILLGIILPDELVEQWQITKKMTFEDAKLLTRVLLFFSAFIYFLVAAYTIFAFTVIRRALCVLVLIILGIIIPAGLIHFLNPEDTSETGRQAVRIILFVMAFVYLLVAAYTIFAFTVIRRARKYLINF